MSIYRKKSAVINSQVRIRNEVSQIFVPNSSNIGISINAIIPVNSTGTISTSISNIDETTAYNIGQNWLNSSYNFYDRSITSICWSPELSLFCGGSTGGYIVNSRDGISWNEIRTSSGNTNGMCWSPKLGIFVAVAYNGNRCTRSTDGETWVNSPGLNTGISWGGVCWSAELGLFCAVGKGIITETTNNNCVGLSIDGINWYPAVFGVRNYGWSFVCWSAELGLFCAVAYDMPPGVSNRIMVSTNGYVWINVGISANGLVCVCWSAELGLFCAVGNNGTIMISNNGYDWTTISGVKQISWSGVCWSAELGLFCAVSSSDVSPTVSENDKVIISRDGITWRTATSGVEPNDWGNICWSPDLGIFCAVSYNKGSTRRAMITNPAYSVPITPIANQTNKYLPLVSSNGTQEIKTKSNVSYNINNNTLNLVNLSTTNLPTCSAIPTNSNDLINKAYLDSILYTQGWIYDDWITGDVSGNLNWTISKPANASIVASDASGHIGILRLNASSNNNTEGITLSLKIGNIGNSFNFSNIKSVKFIVKPFSDQYSESNFTFIGLSDGYSALSNNSVGFYKDQGNGWFCVMNNAKITKIDIPLNIEKKWIVFEIEITNNIPIFYITIENESRKVACAPGTIITNTTVPIITNTTTTTLISPVVSQTRNSIDVDYIDIKYTNMSRK